MHHPVTVKKRDGRHLWKAGLELSNSNGVGFAVWGCATWSYIVLLTYED